VLVAHVRGWPRRARAGASVCTGATVLAAAACFDGRAATTHWAYAEGAPRPPAVTVDPDPIFVATGGRDLGGRHQRVGPHAVVRRGGPRSEVARGWPASLVTYMQRPGTQAR
jgi:putative intracellular protease/amidase